MKFYVTYNSAGRIVSVHGCDDRAFYEATTPENHSLAEINAEIFSAVRSNCADHLVIGGRVERIISDVHDDL